MNHPSSSHDVGADARRPDAEAPAAPVCSAVLLDIDGTLLDSNDAHARAWVEVMRRRGRTLAYDAVRPMIGKGGDKVLSELIGIDPDGDEAERITAERRKIMLGEFLPALRPTPGARDLLRRLRDDGYQLVVATSAGGEELQALLRQAGIADLIEEAATASDAEHSKPDPDILQAALRKARVAPGEAVMIGDTPYDIQAAQAADVPAIALRCGGGWADEAFAGATAIYDDPADLLAHLERSPLTRLRALG